MQRGLWAEPPQASEERWGSEKPARLPPRGTALSPGVPGEVPTLLFPEEAPGSAPRPPALPSLTHPPLLCESLLNVLGVVLKPSGLAPPGFLLWPPWPAPRWVKVPLGAEGCGAEFQGEGGIRGCLQRAGPGEGG